MSDTDDFSYMDDEDYGLEFSEDSNSEPDVDLENQYYNSKAMIDDDPRGALVSFQKVLELEGDQKGEWGFKALQQMIKIYFSLNDYISMMEHYRRILTYIENAVTRNYSETAINSMLEYISTSNNVEILQDFYKTTLDALKHAVHDRLWFKTNTKLGKLYLDRGDFTNLQKILRQLYRFCQTEKNEEDLKKGTQLLDIYALEIQMHTIQKNNAKLRKLYEKSLRIKTAIPHPFILGVILECGGKMHLREGEYDKAHTAFFEAFKSFDETGSHRRIACLKYLVLSNMLKKSAINPFDSHEAKPFKEDPEIVVMTKLVTAFQSNNINEFECILKANHEKIMDDPFIREHIEQLLRNIRIQVLVDMVRPYQTVTIGFIATKLNLEPVEVESLLVSCILDNVIQGKIDQVNQVLHLQMELDKEKAKASRCDAVDKLTNLLDSMQTTLSDKVVNNLK